MIRLFLPLALAASFATSPAFAQMRTVDPNAAMQSDLAPVPPSDGGYAPPADAAPAAGDTGRAPAAPSAPSPAYAPAQADAGPRAGGDTTYHHDDLIGAAEGVFGKGAKGLAKMIEKILKDQGEPNGYIAGREVGGAFVVGLRYGSGTMHHKVEGERPVYWTGPSAGWDFGGNGAKTFVLVYNLYDGQELFRRYPAAEGDVYVVGGLTASYLRRGNVVLIPIRLGVGWRLGANVGYMKFSEKSQLMPF